MPTFGQTINKCVGLNGEVVYQKEPCFNSKGTTINIDKTEDSSSGYQKKQQALEKNLKKLEEEINKSANESERENWKPVTERNTTEKEANSCLDSIKKNYSFKDPRSLLIEDGKFYTLVNGKNRIIIFMNGKNSYGAYSGAKKASCTYESDMKLIDTYYQID